MKAVIFTLGCKVNSRESAEIAGGFAARGYEVSDEPAYADVYVINTCAVTAEAERKSRQAIARLKKFNPQAKVIVCGCASQNAPQSFTEKGAFAVVGARDKDKIFDLLDEGGVDIGASDKYSERYFPLKSGRTREYVKIQDGCNNFCSYCIIPYLRGRSVSRDKKMIKEEIIRLSPVEAVITGINVSDYSFEGDDLASLTEYLADLDCRIRFGSLEACVIDERFLLATKKLKDFAPHFHLSLQSGSDLVLKSMNRHYTCAEYQEKVNLIRSFYPDAAITTDVIVGYSTETEEEFEKSYAFCKNIKFADIHCFPYSVRKGTVGAKLKPIDDAVKKARLDKMLALKQDLKREYLHANLGKTFEFVAEETVDGYCVGYTENYIRVYLNVKGIGEKFKVKLVGEHGDGALAEPV